MENSARGVWSLTLNGRQTEKIDKDKVKFNVRNPIYQTNSLEVEEEKLQEKSSSLWQEILLEELMKLSPSSFETLCQRILRESGFVQVKVTGKSGDGGIDGKGVVKLGSLLSFHVIFQCKRWSGRVSSKEIRDFRGAMTGRTDKGLFITTGTFTRDAKMEASREGAPPIDLIDGNELVDKMKELGLGIKIKKEEVVEIDKDWFSSSTDG